jgi:glyoxylase-like metal-dependent hydrolase (beta-lactamase superfamily II)
VIFSLDVRRARKGDCLIVHYGSKDDPGLALIDGGPGQVYKAHLKPRLKEIKKARGLTDVESLPVNLLMVSHIDDDHINGILELTNELVAARDAG